MLGVDCEDISYFADRMNSIKWGPMHSLFTEEEHRHCAGFDAPAANYAGIWCAKEAAVKALSQQMPLRPDEVEISHDRSGRPFVAQPRSISLELHVSITHSRTTAMAAAVLLPATWPGSVA